MISKYWLFSIVAALAIILALAFYAGRLLRQLAQQKKRQEQAIVEQKLALQQHDKNVLDSVLIITRAMQEKQCDFSEGCWRIAVLLDSLKLTTQLEQRFPAIFELYSEIKHFSILDNRKKLAKKQRMREDYQRMTVEARLYKQIESDLSALHQYTLEKINRLADGEYHK